MTPPWDQLYHAFGPATDLPELLDALSPDPSDPLWGELWGRVCHQGSIYPASRYVLPFLLNLAAGWSEPGRIMPLVLASAIAASPEFDARGFEDSIEHLRILAGQSLRAKDINRADRVYLMSAALTLDGDRVWGPALEGFNSEEFPGTCPACGGQLYFTIGDLGFRTTTRPDDHLRQEKITPCFAEDLHGVGAWLLGIALDVGDAGLGERITHLFGETVCTNCDRRISVHEAVARFAGGA